jgi:hypothetical protein
MNIYDGLDCQDNLRLPGAGPTGKSRPLNHPVGFGWGYPDPYWGEI